MMTDSELEIGPIELARALENGEPIQVLDVRAPHRLANGRVEPVPSERFLNIPGSQLLGMDLSRIGLEASTPVAVVCSLGNDSLVVARTLRQRGFEARSLRGGVTGWMRIVLPRELDPPAGFDRLIQFDRVGKGALGYVLASDGEAIVIDPSRDWQRYVEAAGDAGARVAAVADTHVHADYISGAADLARALEVPYYLHPADAVYPYDGTPGNLDHVPLADGAELSVGRGRLLTVHTPGHTEGHAAFVAGSSATPLADGEAVFTGDFIFVESVGRPDLAGKTDEWCGDLWRSLVRARETWPDTLRILPGHYARDSERNEDRSVERPFGELRVSNAALRMAEEAAFRAWVAGSVTAPPAAYARIKAINVGLVAVSNAEADLLEAGKNECALG